MQRVRPRVTGLRGELLGLDRANQFRHTRVRLGVEDVRSGRAQTRDDEVTPFDSLFGELEIYASDVGMTPLQAIHAATGAASLALGIADTVGTLRAGKDADLIVVDGDPSERIADLRAVRMVMRGGRIVAENRVVLD